MPVVDQVFTHSGGKHVGVSESSLDQRHEVGRNRERGDHSGVAGRIQYGLAHVLSGWNPTIFRSLLDLVPLRIGEPDGSRLAHGALTSVVGVAVFEAGRVVVGHGGAPFFGRMNIDLLWRGACCESRRTVCPLTLVSDRSGGGDNYEGIETALGAHSPAYRPGDEGLSHQADEESFDLGVCRSWIAGASGTYRKRAGRIAVLQGPYIGRRQAQPCTDRDGERGVYRRDIRSVQQEQDAQRRRLYPKANAIGANGTTSIIDAWGVRTKAAARGGERQTPG